MTTQQKQEKILASIEARGWFSSEIYLDAAQSLRSQGAIKMDSKYFVGGNRKMVWVRA